MISNVVREVVHIDVVVVNRRGVHGPKICGRSRDGEGAEHGRSREDRFGRSRKICFLEVDISCNSLGDGAAAHFIGWLRRQPIPVQLFKLYKNRIGDMSRSGDRDFASLANY